MRKVCAVITCFAGVIFFVCSAPRAHADDWSKTYKLSGRPDLRVITNDAHVDLYTSSANEIDAHVSTTGYHISDRDVRITQTQTGNNITLEVHVPSFWGFGWINRSVRIELHVPHEADFDIETGDGSVTSQSFHGNLRISSGDGSINVSGLSGQVRLHSGDGHIRGDAFDGALNADSGDGSISVSGRFDSLQLESGDGSIHAESSAGSKVSGDWSLRSGDGSVWLALPDGLNADLEAHTGDGHITLDYPVTTSGEISGKRIRGKIGVGGPPLILHSGDGSIHISKM